MLDREAFKAWLIHAGYASATQYVYSASAQMFEAYCAAHGLAVTTESLTAYEQHLLPDNYALAKTRATAIRAYLRFLADQSPGRYRLYPGDAKPVYEVTPRITWVIQGRQHE